MSAAALSPAAKVLGSGEPATVFLHGIGGHSASFDGQLPAFAGRRRAIAWDMPGYGASPPLSPMTFAGLADALRALLADLDTGPVLLVGHSMGGMVAQSFAARHPALLRGLVLAATSPAFGKPGGDWQKAFLAARLAPLDRGRIPADFADELVDGMVNPATPAAARAAAAASMRLLSPETYRAALECIVGFDERAALGAIACPTLCLAAELDSLAPPDVVERMAGKIPGAAYRCLPGLGHLANVEDAAAFNAAILEFAEANGL